MPDQPGSGGIAYLSTLHPPQDLAIWLSSYDDEGLWEVAKLALPVVETTQIGTYRGTKRRSAKLPIDPSVPVLKRARKKINNPPGIYFLLYFLIHLFNIVFFLSFILTGCTANNSVTTSTVNTIDGHQDATVPILKRPPKNKKDPPGIHFLLSFTIIIII